MARTCDLPNCDNEYGRHREYDRESIWVATTALGASTGSDVLLSVCSGCYDDLRQQQLADA